MIQLLRLIKPHGKFSRIGKKPFLTAFSDKDPITRGGEKAWQDKVPGAKDQQHVIIQGAGHFLQEEKGPELAKVITDFCRSNPLKSS